MKTFSLVLFVILLFVSPSYALIEMDQLLAGAITTPSVSRAGFGGMAMTSFGCSISVAGTAPTSVTILVEGSLDNSTWVTLKNHIYAVSDTSGKIVSGLNTPPFRYIRATYSSRSGGDGTTAVTVKCSAGGK